MDASAREKAIEAIRVAVGDAPFVALVGGIDPPHDMICNTSAQSAYELMALAVWQFCDEDVDKAIAFLRAAVTAQRREDLYMRNLP
jgi:hypothetical protein